MCYIQYIYHISLITYLSLKCFIEAFIDAYRTSIARLTIKSNFNFIYTEDNCQ